MIVELLFDENTYFVGKQCLRIKGWNPDNVTEVGNLSLELLLRILLNHNLTKLLEKSQIQCPKSKHLDLWTHVDGAKNDWKEMAFDFAL